VPVVNSDRTPFAVFVKFKVRECELDSLSFGNTHPPSTDSLLRVDSWVVWGSESTRFISKILTAAYYLKINSETFPCNQAKFLIKISA